MPLVLTDAKVTINDGTVKDISQYVKSVTLDISASEHQTTTMGAGAHTRVAGLKDGSVAIDFVDDFATGNIDSILWSVFNAGSNVAMTVRTSSAAISASNPEFRFNVCPTAYSLGGEVDSLAEKSVTYPISGPVVRATSA